MDEEWKASDVYEALLLEESKEAEPEAEVVVPQPVESEGMTAEEQEGFCERLLSIHRCLHLYSCYIILYYIALYCMVFYASGAAYYFVPAMRHGRLKKSKRLLRGNSSVSNGPRTCSNSWAREGLKRAHVCASPF